MKNSKVAALLGVAALALSACGGGKAGESASSKENATKGPAAKQIDYRACIVSDAGGWDDKSFNQSAKEGLDKAVHDLGVRPNTAESKSDNDFAPNVKSMVEAKCNLTIGVGFKLSEAVENAAKSNPDKQFAIVDATFQNQPENARALVFNTHEAAYLAGYAAAANSKSGKVGTFGGIKLPTVTIFMDGFADGVARYNKDHKKDVKVLGWNKETQEGQFTNTFDDQSKGTAVANQLIQQGADVIMPVAGPVGLGAAAAAKSNGKTLIVGVDSDWYESASEYKDIVLTSVQKGINSAVVDTIKSGVEKKFDKAPYVGTLKNGGVSLAPFHDLQKSQPKGLEDELKKIKEEIVSGKTVVKSSAAYEVK